MVYKLIENYIKSLEIDDVDKFAKENDITLNNDELKLIYETIKKDWYQIIYGNYNNIFNDLRVKLAPNTYKKTEELFFYFKNKYQKFL